MKRLVFFVSVLLLLIFGGENAGAATIDDLSFTWRSPYPQGNSITELVFAEERFLSAYSTASSHMRSANGVAWDPLTLPTKEDVITTYAVGQGKVLAFYRSGDELYYSLDNGLKWEKGNPLPVSCVMAATYGGDLFVAVSQKQAFMYSSDGLNWNVGTVTNADAGDAYLLVDVAYGNGIYVAVGTAAYDGVIYTSKDGKNWTKQKVLQGRYLSLVYFDGIQFLLCHDNGIYTSTDGVQWKEAVFEPEVDFYAMAMHDSLYVGAGYFGIFTSRDGVEWTKTVDTYPLRMYAAAYGNGVFVVAGEAGAIYTSRDGETWTPRELLPEGYMEKVVRGLNGYVAISNTGIVFSQDGKLPRKGKIHKRGYSFIPTVRALAYGGGKYIVGALAYPTSKPRQRKGVLLVSKDGLNWGMKPAPDNAMFFGLTYGKGMFMGSGQVMNDPQLPQHTYSSTDGIHWKKRLNDIGSEAIAFSKGLFMLPLIYHNSIHYSKDGIKWIKKTTGNLKPAAIAYDGTTFVASDERGYLYSSKDGAKWTLRHRFKSNELSRCALSWGGGVFLAVVEEYEQTKGGVYKPTYHVSRDGLTWKSYVLPALGYHLLDASFALDRFVVSGTGGLVMESRRIQLQ